MSYDRFRELFMSSKAIAAYNTDSRGFRKRFDVERMDTDSVYRDSVRMVIRDSLMTHSPEYRKRIEREQQEELKKQQEQKDSTRNLPDTSKVTEPKKAAIKNEEEEGESNEK